MCVCGWVSTLKRSYVVFVVMGEARVTKIAHGETINIDQYFSVVYYIQCQKTITIEKIFSVLRCFSRRPHQFHCDWRRADVRKWKNNRKLQFTFQWWIYFYRFQVVYVLYFFLTCLAWRLQFQRAYQRKNTTESHHLKTANISIEYLITKSEGQQKRKWQEDEGRYGKREITLMSLNIPSKIK